MKTIITGITGQTGSYLTEILLEQGHEIYGLVRRSSTFSTERIDHVFDNPKLKLIYGDLADYSSISSLIAEVKPDYFYNLGAMSHVRVSFDIPEYTFDIDGTGVIRVLEALRRNSPNTRFLQASTSELYGAVPPPHNENTPFHPRSPYAVAKIAGYWATVNYREAYGMYCVNSISHNHESPRRGETFVTRKITRAATRIKLGLQKDLRLGNLEAKRDWSHAKDIACAMKMMLESDKEPTEYVVGSEKMHSVKDFLELVFRKLDLKPHEHVHFDPRYLRPSEVPALCADASKIKNNLGWKPNYTFEQLVDEMVREDLKLAEREKLINESENE